MRTAIYPGSFDPLTNGHLDVIHRASKLFDRLIVAIAHNERKIPLFSVEARVSFIKEATAGCARVETESFDGLLVDFVQRQGGQAIIRGLRTVWDFEFEFRLAQMNRTLNDRVETIFMMPKETYTFISSTMVKEIARLGGDISAFVPDNIAAALRQRLGQIQQP